MSASWIAVGERLGQSIADEWPQRLADGRRGLGEPADDGRVLDHPAHDGREVGEAARPDLHADGVAHDVFELVGLVDHHDIVLGQQHVPAGDVEAVEVQVDHDDIGDGCPGAGQLGKAHRTHRALGAAGAFVAADADGLPRAIVRRPGEVGLVAGLRVAGPFAQSLDVDLGRGGEVLDLQLTLTRRRLQLAHALHADVVAAPLQHGPVERPARGVLRGTEGPWSPIDPAAPSSRWPRRSACRPARPARGSPASCPCPCPPARSGAFRV